MPRASPRAAPPNDSATSTTGSSGDGPLRYTYVYGDPANFVDPSGLEAFDDVGEAPGVAAAREVEEESGYRVRTVKLLAVYDKLRHGHPPESFHAYELFFHCELVGGTAATSDETTAVGFFAENALPPLSLARVTEAQIRRMFEHSRDASLPSDYD